MKKIIINADDCGISKVVNEHIEQAILAEKITSTTVMANMEDFEGSVRLYKQYSKQISFGWHINLSEGKPLLYSQLLLDKGFYKETAAGVEMNGKSFLRKWLSSAVRNEIKRELMAQYAKLRDSGIVISHIDSHHHVHTSIWAITLIPNLLEDTKINAMRNISNNYSLGIDSLVRRGWTNVMKIQAPKLAIPDILSGYQRFMKLGLVGKGGVVELECHPGHPSYKEEEKLLFATTLSGRYELINYKQFAAIT